MDIPPKLAEIPAKQIEVEVLPPVVSSPKIEPPPEGPPIHSISALILVAIDSLWLIFDWLVPVWLIAIPLCFVATFIPVYLVQRNLKHDSPSRALTFATALAILAAIPTPITGTPIGLGLLAWTGLGKLFGKAPKS